MAPAAPPPPLTHMSFAHQSIVINKVNSKGTGGSGHRLASCLSVDMYVRNVAREEAAIVVFLLGCVCSQYLQTQRREGELYRRGNGSRK